MRFPCSKRLGVSRRRRRGGRLACMGRCLLTLVGVYLGLCLVAAGHLILEAHEAGLIAFLVVDQSEPPHSGSAEVAGDGHASEGTKVVLICLAFMHAFFYAAGTVLYFLHQCTERRKEVIDKMRERQARARERHQRKQIDKLEAVLLGEV